MGLALKRLASFLILILAFIDNVLFLNWIRLWEYADYKVQYLSRLKYIIMYKEKKDLSIKIVIVGDVGVGKSSIAIRYVYDKFDVKQ